MGSYAVFVDAAYLTHGAARVMRRPVTEVAIDSSAVVRWAGSLSPTIGAGDRLLRVYWYDGAFDPGHRGFQRQRRYFDLVEETPGLALRLGYVVERTPSWQRAVRHAVRACGVSLSDFARHYRFVPERTQKGVDALLTIDLVGLAQRRAYDTAVLVAGDRDFAQAVAIAQSEGRRVIVAVPSTADLSPQLRRSADAVLLLDRSTLLDFRLRSDETGGGPAGGPAGQCPRPSASASAGPSSGRLNA